VSQNEPRIRALTIADLADVVRLQAAVAATVPDGHLWPKTDDDLRGYLGGTLGAAYGIDGQGGLSAFALLRLPVAGRPYVGPPFPRIPAQDWPARACFVENALVEPAARGRGYQRALFDVRAAHARRVGMRWLCSGVHLGNTVSWANLLAKGMVIAGMRVDPGYPIIGLLLPLATPPLATDATDRRLVDAPDAAGHAAALQQGYIGVRRDARGAVVYERVLAVPAAPV
jgi:GNAT superfamily N-acetyltransferase